MEEGTYGNMHLKWKVRRQSSADFIACSGTNSEMFSDKVNQ